VLVLGVGVRVGVSEGVGEGVSVGVGLTVTLVVGVPDGTGRCDVRLGEGVPTGACGAADVTGGRVITGVVLGRRVGCGEWLADGTFSTGAGITGGAGELLFW
jgi:hypothetical protein